MKAKKEVIVAIIIGLLFSALVIGGILRARSAFLNMRQAATDEASPAPISTSVETQGLFLELETEDNQVVKEPKFTISGKTLPNTYIVINGEKGDSIITPNELGAFSQEIALTQGANTIKVTAYLEDGTKSEKSLTVVHSTSDI